MREGKGKNMIIHWAQLILGLWILVSPWVLDFASISIMKWSNVIVGISLILINVWVIFGSKRPASGEQPITQ